MKRIAFILLAASTVLTSCSSDDDNNNDAVGSSRTLKYEVTGNFTGTMFASYTTADGMTNNDPITLPWNKEITFEPTVTAANIVLSGNGGASGQQVTLIIRRDGRTINSPTTAIANNSGSFSKAAPVVVF